MNIRNITTACCGEVRRAPGLAVECPQCHAVYQIRESDRGTLMLTRAPYKMSPRRSRLVWWRRALSRIPLVGREFRSASQSTFVHVEDS